MAMALTLLFELGQDLYGLEIDAIQEIVEEPVVYHAPNATGVVTGAINFHGQILAAIDLPALLGYPGDPRDPRRVVLAPGYRALALAVSGIQRIVNLDATFLEPPQPGAGEAIRGMAYFEGTPVRMLDTDDVNRRLADLYER